MNDPEKQMIDDDVELVLAFYKRLGETVSRLTHEECVQITLVWLEHVLAARRDEQRK